MRKMKLASRLIGGFLLVALLLLAGGLVGFSGITIVKNRLADFVSGRVESGDALAAIIDAHENILGLEQSFLIPEIMDDAAVKEKLQKDMDAAWRKAEEAWRKYDRLPRDAQIDALYKKAGPLWQAWHAADEEFMGAVHSGDREGAVRIMAARVEQEAQVSRQSLKELAQGMVQSDMEALSFAVGQGNSLAVVALIGTFIGIVLAIGLGFYFSRSITRPIYQVIENLAQTGQQFAEAAAQIALSSNHLAEGTSIQASAVEETYSATEELNSSNAKYKGVIDDLKSRLAMTNTIGMEAFGTMKEAKKAMKGIKQTSEETSVIVEEIEKIAFQTNLLALSASVEAARAGGAGGGFAVVSDDIRSLGARSTEAARNSISLIGQTAAIAGNGNDYIGLSIRKFIEYGTSSMHIYTYTEEASKVADEQMNGVNKVNVLLESISKSAQANAAEAEEASSVAEETTAQAMSVQAVVKELAGVVGYDVS